MGKCDHGRALFCDFLTHFLSVSGFDVHGSCYDCYEMVSR